MISQTGAPIPKTGHHPVIFQSFSEYWTKRGRGSLAPLPLWIRKWNCSICWREKVLNFVESLCCSSCRAQEEKKKSRNPFWVSNDHFFWYISCEFFPNHLKTSLTSTWSISTSLPLGAGRGTIIYLIGDPLGEFSSWNFPWIHTHWQRYPRSQLRSAGTYFRGLSPIHGLRDLFRSTGIGSV